VPLRPKSWACAVADRKRDVRCHGSPSERTDCRQQGERAADKLRAIEHLGRGERAVAHEDQCNRSARLAMFLRVRGNVVGSNRVFDSAGPRPGSGVSREGLGQVGQCPGGESSAARTTPTAGGLSSDRAATGPYAGP
jgi:hypothetical protein